MPDLPDDYYDDDPLTEAELDEIRRRISLSSAHPERNLSFTGPEFLEWLQGWWPD